MPAHPKILASAPPHEDVGAALVAAVPVPVGRERAWADELARRARAAGLVVHRPFGHPGAPSSRGAELGHLLLGAAAVGLAALWPPGGIGVGLVGFASAFLRATGHAGLGPIFPSVPSWTLVLGASPERARVLVAAPLDRAGPSRGEAWAVAAALGVAVLSAARLVHPAFAGAVLGAAALWTWVATWLGASRADAREAVRALVDHALGGGVDADTALVFAGGSAADGEGVRDLLDWWARRPQDLEVWWLGDAPGARGVAADGWTVRVVSPAILARSRS